MIAFPNTVRASLMLLLAAALALAGCDRAETLRYRLVVEVDTPEGLKTGSSVIEVEVREQSSEIHLGNRVRLRARGEAVAVDLPGGKVLFALLRDETSSDAVKVYPWRAFDPPKGDGHEWGVHAARELKQRGQPRAMPPRYYPMLVTFADLSAPLSVERVDPDDLAATFGEGVTLQRITVQVTDDPVTTGIEERLGWLPNYYDKMLDGQRLNTIHAENRLANDLSQGAFSKGILQ